MKKQPNYNQIELERRETYECETIEAKLRRILANKEPIEAISPTIYTERKDGALPEYNIRTDRFEIAQKAMEKIATNKRNIRMEKIKKETETQQTETTKE